jgi:hypothetical protein
MEKATALDPFRPIFRRRLPSDLKIRADALCFSVNVHGFGLLRLWTFRLRLSMNPAPLSAEALNP